MESEKIAKRAIKISIASLFILLVSVLILISIWMTQINAMAQMSQKLQILEAKVKALESA